METFVLSNNFSLSLALFDFVTNVSELKQKAINGELGAALLSPSMILEPFQVLIAANKVLHNKKCNKLITKNLYSELIFCLSPSKNMSTSFQTFGISNKDERLLVAEFHEANQSRLPEISQHILGSMVPLSQLSNFSNIPQIKSIYKIKDAEFTVGNLLDSVVTRIATKDLISI